MDAFDAARRSAAALHSAAVERGADPCKSCEIVERAAEELGIEIERVTPDNSILNGALANYHVESGLVCCSDDGDEIQQALLIAHELGHARLHTTESNCNDGDIDAAASVERVPVGLERVTDYGARERRELHANVFARELLLPTSLAKGLFLDQRLSATSISELTALPLPMVRQQILDAVLLPVPQDAADMQRVEPPLDDSQRVAAHHKGSAYNLQAGPGTGKTRTLVERVRWLIEHGTVPSAILVLTFSNRAAAELAERFAAALPDAATQIWTGTFHAFGLDLVRRFHDRLGRSTNPVLYDRSDAIAALEELLPTLPLKHYRNLWNPALPLREILVGISRAKDELTDVTRYRELGAEMLSEAHSEEEVENAQRCLEAADVYEHYERMLDANDALDFGDLIMLPTLLLESDPGLRAQLSDRHRHILVDEFQDVNRASARLLKAISGDAERLWVVGDARQSIYRFRGASPANLLSFKSDFNGTSGQLAVNYRSTRQIVDAFCGVARHLKASEYQPPLSLEANKGDGPSKPQMVVCADPDAEYATVAESIRHLQTNGVALQDQAVLCRSNAKLAAVAEALEGSGIPVLHLGSIFERDDVRDLLALLSLSVDRFASGLARVGGWPRYGLNLQDVYRAVNWLKKEERPPIDGLEACACEAGLSDDGASGLKHLADDLKGLSPWESPWNFLCTYLLDRTDALREVDRDKTVAGQMTSLAIWQFLNFVQAPTFGKGPAVRRLLDRVRELVLLAEERGLREVPKNALHVDAVRLMTIHGSKGLEFDAIHVPGLNSQSFPIHWSGLRYPLPRGLAEGREDGPVIDQLKLDLEAEEQCLFFVALSRAKTFARFYRSETSSSGRKTTPSPYLAWLAEAGAAEINGGTATAAPSGDLGKIDVHTPRASSITPADLRLYERCPRRFFYTCVLGLANARQRTAFMLTHSCIHAFLKRFREMETLDKTKVGSVTAIFDEIWEAKGPTEHTFAREYRALAQAVLKTLIELPALERRGAATEITLAFPAGEVVVALDEAGDAAGRSTIRRLNTGKKNKSEKFDDSDYSAYLLAAEQVGAEVEAVFLTSGHREVIQVSPTIIKNRRKKVEGLLAGIQSGRFDPAPDAVKCPVCPHFFICAAAPKGALTID